MACPSSGVHENKASFRWQLSPDLWASPLRNKENVPSTFKNSNVPCLDHMRVNIQVGRLNYSVRGVTLREAGERVNKISASYFLRLHADSNDLKIESLTENNEREIKACPSSFPLIRPTEVSLLEAFLNNGQEVPVNRGSARTLDCAPGSPPLRNKSLLQSLGQNQDS